MEFNFKNAQAVISRRMVLLEKQQELLQLSKEKALGDVDAFFDKIIHVNIFVGMNYLPFNDSLFTMTI